MALCTLAEVKLQLGKTSTTDDVELQSYIDAVTDPIEDYCGPILPATVSEWHDTSNADYLLLRSERIVSVTSVLIYSGTTATTYTAVTDPSVSTTYGFLVDPALNGIVRNLSGGSPQTFSGRVLVTYVAGMAAVPASINLAARLMVQSLWRSQNGGANVPSLTDEQQIPGDSYEEMIHSARVVMLLSRYRRTPSLA